MFQLPKDYEAVRHKIDKELWFDPEGRWVQSALNRYPGCRPIPQVERVMLNDTTCREALNQLGVNPTLEQKMRLAEKLEEAGVTDIEVGQPEIREHREFMQALKRSGTKMRVSAPVLLPPRWDFKGPADAAIGAGIDRIRIAVQNLSYYRWPGLDETASLNLLRDCIRYIKKRVEFVYVAQIGGTSLDLNRKIFLIATEEGASRICLQDTQGNLIPESVAFLVRFTRDIVGDDMEISFHGHNDYGLATINTVSAAIAGANFLDVVVNGMFQLAGFAEVVLALETLYDIKTGINLAKIYEVCKVAEKEFGSPIPPMAPHIGEWHYLDTGMHGEFTGGVDHKWWVLENIKAETIGQHRFGYLTPTSLDRGGMEGAIAHRVKALGYAFTESKLASIFDKMREAFVEKPYLTYEEMEKIIRMVCS